MEEPGKQDTYILDLPRQVRKDTLWIVHGKPQLEFVVDYQLVLSSNISEGVLSLGALRWDYRDGRRAASLVVRRVDPSSSVVEQYRAAFPPAARSACQAELVALGIAIELVSGLRGSFQRAQSKRWRAR